LSSYFTGWLWQVVGRKKEGFVMSKKEPAAMEQERQNEVKERIPAWLYPSTIAVMDGALKQGNCKSRSDFLDQAALFYAGYLSGKDACAYLPPALVSAFKGTIRDSEGRLARLLFKLAVELDMMMNILAAGMEVSESTLQGLRERCIQEVRQTGGNITLLDAVRYQNEA